MREEAEAKVTEDVNAVNEFMEVYHEYIPPLSGGPPTAYDMLMLKIENVKNSVSALTEVLKAENPPGKKLNI